MLAIASAPLSGDEADVALQFTLARSLSEEGTVTEALEAWQELLLMAPEEPYVRVEFARFLSRIGRLDEAVEQVARGRDLAPRNADVLRGFADLHLSAARTDPNRLEAARQALEDLVEVEPENVEAMFDLGRALYEEGRFSDAAVWLEQAARRQPGNRMLQAYRIDSLLQSRQDEQAETILRDVLAEDASFLRGRLQLARLQSERGDHLASVSTLRAAPAEELKDRGLRWQLAGELYRIGELEEGVEVLDSLLVDQPTAFRERMLKGMTLAALGRDEAAIGVYSALRVERPLNLDIVSEMVKLYERQDRPGAAEELLRDVERRLAEEGEDRRIWRVRFELMSHLWRSESWAELVREARPLAEDAESSLHVQSVFYLVDALHGSGQSVPALEMLQEVSAAGVGASHRVGAKRAEILTDLGRGEEADAVLEGLAKSAELSAQMAAAEVYQRQERYQEAVEVLERALQRAEDSSQILYWLGAAYERSGEQEQAVLAFRKLLALDPQYAPALNYLGYIWAERGENLDEALDLVNRAVAQEPDNGAYVDSLGWAHFQVGDHVRARELLERASRLVPDDAVISEHLGDVYAELGEAERARELYRRALRLDGDNREIVRRKLDRLLIPR